MPHPQTQRDWTCLGGKGGGGVGASGRRGGGEVVTGKIDQCIMFIPFYGVQYIMSIGLVLKPSIGGH